MVVGGLDVTPISSGTGWRDVDGLIDVTGPGSSRPNNSLKDGWKFCPSDLSKVDGRNSSSYPNPMACEGSGEETDPSSDLVYLTLTGCG